jgi:hypothetical protein
MRGKPEMAEILKDELSERERITDDQRHGKPTTSV